jgi:hypothetical protein
MIKLFFESLERQPSAYWLILAMPTAVLLGLIVHSIWVGRESDEGRSRDWIFALVVGLFLLAWRWPFLFEAREYNPDESQLIAGAATLAHDPVFWRSVDGTTSGPLNFYALVPISWLGLPLDYFTARLMGLMLVAIGLISTYRLFRTFAPPAPAQLAVLPAVIFFATTGDEDFVHYSSEHVSLALLGLAGLGLWRRSKDEREEKSASVLGALAAGLLPWAKLQTAPLSVVLIGWKLCTIITEPNRSARAKRESCFRLIIAAAAPSLFALLAIVVTGQTEHFVQTYVLQNLVYVSEGMSLALTISQLAEFTSNTHTFPVFLGVSLFLLLLTGVLYATQRRRPNATYLAGAIYTLAAVFCILAPRRPFPHYLLLAILPITFWCGAAITQLWNQVTWKRSLGMTVFGISCVFALGLRFSQGVPYTVERLAESWRRPHTLAGTILRAYTKSGDYLGVWGWRTDVYVDAGLIQATRDPHSVWSIVNTPNRAYHRARYLSDLQRHQPSVFIDSVGPNAFVYHVRAEHGHETFPELATYIRENYTLLGDLGKERIYLHKNYDGNEPRELAGSKLQEYVRQSRRDPDTDAPPPDTIEPADLSGWDINGRGVRSLQPPTRMTWILQGNERGFSIEYGFHPRAYTEGKTNGAEFIVELHVEGHPPREVYRDLIDPVRFPADRAELIARATLPALTPGTKLVIRTEAGEFNDAAWDWVYVGRVRFLRSPAYLADQFPEFHRVPDRVDAERATLRKENGRHTLELNAPATLTYVLDGQERKLDFSYGVESKTFSGPDGARFRVELRSDQAATRIIFDRTLKPKTVPAERERQWAKLELPPSKSGDLLVLRIDEESPGAGKTAYVTDLVLK